MKKFIHVPENGSANFEVDGVWYTMYRSTASMSAGMTNAQFIDYLKKAGYTFTEHEGFIHITF